MKKRFIINNDIYNSNMIICVGYSGSEMISYIKKNTDYNISDIENMLKNEDANACYFRVPGISESFIWIPEFEFCSQTIAELSHEILHHINNTLPYRGIKLCKETDEVYAYYMSGLMGEILSKIAIEHNKIEKKKSKKKK